MKKRTKTIIFGCVAGYLAFVASLLIMAFTAKPCENVDRSNEYDDDELAELVKAYGEEAILKGE